MASRPPRKPMPMPAVPRPPVVIRNHDTSPQLAYLDTSPDISQLMGKFRPARYVGARQGAYVVAAGNLTMFQEFARHYNIPVIDERNAIPANRPLGRERPLPECSHCGQPAKRETRLAYCPNCGKPWQPIEVDPTQWTNASATTCQDCGATQRVGHDWCGSCGSRLPHHQTQLGLRGGQALQEPLPIGQVMADMGLKPDG